MLSSNDDPSPQQLSSALERLAHADPALLGKARKGAARLGLREPGMTDTAAAIQSVEELAVIDVDIPTDSRIPAAGFLKQVVKRLVSWYLRYIGGQITAFGHGVANLGQVLDTRVAAVDHRADALSRRMDDLEQRLGRLEDEPGR